MLKFKIMVCSLILLVLSGCSTKLYDFKMVEPEKEFLVSFDKKNSKIELSKGGSLIELSTLENKIGVDNPVKLMVKLTNKSSDILIFKGRDIRIGFNDFWFYLDNYEILGDNEELNFKNKDNFLIKHSILPDQSLNLILTFKTPLSKEYYKNKLSIFEIYTNLSIYRVLFEVGEKESIFDDKF